MNYLKDFFSEKSSPNSYIPIPGKENPRIIIPVRNLLLYKEGFRIHNTASPKNRLLKTILINGYYIVKRLNKSQLFAADALLLLRDYIKNKFDLTENPEFSIYIGTKDKNQKITFQVMDQKGRTLGYMKLMHLENHHAIQNEFDTCELLNTTGISSFKFPDNLFFENWNSYKILMQSDISKETLPSGYDLDRRITDCCIELMEKTKIKESKIIYLEDFKSKVSETLKNLVSPEVFEELVLNINYLLSIDFPLFLNHGDYTPYNIRVLKDKLVIFDWELSDINGLPFFDLFHFLYQGSYQIFNLSPTEILKRKFNNPNNVKEIKRYADALHISYKSIPGFFQIYLVNHLINDLFNKKIDKLDENHFYQGLLLNNEIRKVFSYNES